MMIPLRYLPGLALLVVLGVANADGPANRVINLSASPSGSGEVVLSFDVVAAGGRAEILFEFSDDDGRTWRKPAHASGDFGHRVGQGGRRIHWDYYEQFPKGLQGRITFRVETRAEREQLEALRRESERLAGEQREKLRAEQSRLEEVRRKRLAEEKRRL